MHLNHQTARRADPGGAQRGFARPALGLSVAISLALAGPVHAQGEANRQLLESPVPSDRARMGSAVAVGQRVAVVGAPGNSQKGLDAGAAYIYDRDATTGAYAEGQLIQPSTLDPFDRFGGAVAVSGNVLVLGAKGDDEAAPNAGAAYVYTRAGVGSPFTLLQKLVPPSAGVSDCYGISVAVASTRIAVGAPRSDQSALDAGAVYLYEYDAVLGEFVDAGVVLDPAAGVGDQFGISVGLSLDQLFVGAERLDDPAGDPNVGGVVVFDDLGGQSWVVSQRLLVPGLGDGSELGATLAVDPPRQGVPGSLFVGAPSGHPSGTVNALGTVHIFEAPLGGPWDLALDVGLDGTVTDTERGRSVAIQNGVAIVGLPGLDFTAGAFEVLRRDMAAGWQLEGQYRIPDSQAGDRAGSGVGLLNSHPIIGVPGRDSGSLTDLGLAWSQPHLWAPIGETLCSPGVPNSTGDSAVLMARGSTLASDQDLVLEGALFPRNSFAFAIVSLDTGFVPQPGGSSGNLCLGGQIGRLVDRATQAGIDGRIEIVVDVADIPQPLGGQAAQAGDTWWFQVWYRDANPQVTSNYTDALGVTFQ